jgi:hypothetical protein
MRNKKGDDTMFEKKALTSSLDTSKSDKLDKFFGPWTEAQVRDAFERVENEDHWKGPIDTFIILEDFELTAFAVSFFTATNLKIVGRSRHVENLVHVRAAGYWNGPAN